MKALIEYKWKYLLQQIIGLFKSVTTTSDYLFITHSGSDDWILGAKARRLSKYFIGNSKVLSSKNFKNLPKAPGYFFLHQRYYAKALRYNPFLKKERCIVMFTHPEWNKYYSKSHAIYTLKNAFGIVCLNQQMKKELVNLGLEPSKISVFHLASNPEAFPPKQVRDGNTVGFCCYYSERKNPELVYNLVTQMPDLNFILIGRNWENYPKFKDLENCDNFSYYDNLPYERYPEMYRKMDVFVSPSYLEGGPVPLLEAMLSNVIPVASNTGFCPDIIRHKDNGYLFDAENPDLLKVQKYIRLALENSVNTRLSVIDFSWEKYGKAISQLFKV